LFKLLRIGANRAEVAIVVHLERDFLAQQTLQQQAYFAHHIGQLEHLGPQGLLAAEGEQLAGQRRRTVGVRADLLDVVVIAVAGGVAQ